ncbi:hypothetical protein K504DRAFT_288964 [Pleomassaria siparia CBS 279.74]|uniref:Uncharacterized protein n=1 Tax=Pleomassaria siparia CBS 279.74 TaxID=1314801 RepID=A0A6G1K8I8_9PLEO|nr:hypothetical protein K504DRAFT_288964 [Pleomassaria siparia CBS 279.74]
MRPATNQLKSYQGWLVSPPRPPPPPPEMCGCNDNDKQQANKQATSNKPQATTT